MQRLFKRHDPHIVTRSPDWDPRKMRVDLVILRGRAQNTVRPIQVPAFLLGTAPDCDLVLGDPQFPEVYAYIRLSDEGVSIRHLGFQPELTVNGEKVTKAQLRNGDRIRTGPYEFEVRIRRTQEDTTDPSNGQEEPCPLSLQADRVEDDQGNAKVESLLEDIRLELSGIGASVRFYPQAESHAVGPFKLVLPRGRRLA